jgi:hypothetical protein
MEANIDLPHVDLHVSIATPKMEAHDFIDIECALVLCYSFFAIVTRYKDCIQSNEEDPFLLLD